MEHPLQSLLLVFATSCEVLQCKAHVHVPEVVHDHGLDVLWDVKYFEDIYYQLVRHRPVGVGLVQPYDMQVFLLPLGGLNLFPNLRRMLCTARETRDSSFLVVLVSI